MFVINGIRGAERTFWSPFGAQFGREFGEVRRRDEFSVLAEGLSPNRFWIPGRGQNG
jgi:hypothetical protein